MKFETAAFALAGAQFNLNTAQFRHLILHLIILDKSTRTLKVRKRDLYIDELNGEVGSLGRRLDCVLSRLGSAEAELSKPCMQHVYTRNEIRGIFQVGHDCVTIAFGIIR